MKKAIKFLCFLLGVFMMFSCFACWDSNTGGNDNSDDNPNKIPEENPPVVTPVLQPAEEKEWVNINTYSAQILDAYVQPIWYTREVYDESVAITSEWGSANLLYTPKGKVTVRDYRLQKTYVEGVDYEINGKTITRLEDGELPYKDGVYEDNDVNTKAPLEYMVNVSYRTDEVWEGAVPEAQTEKVAKFMNKVKTQKSASIMFYGDSITVGCSASDSDEGGHINPKLPIWPDLVTTWLESKYNANIQTWNKATGGWLAKDGADNFDDRVMSVGATNIDLLVLAFGGNDKNTLRNSFIQSIKGMADKYLNANPNGTVLLVSSMNPNTQSVYYGNQKAMEKWLAEDIANNYDNVALAQVNSVFTQLETSGKLTRDWLANNVNHPNDFGVRIYAQVLLKTLAGDDFCKEIYA